MQKYYIGMIVVKLGKYFNNGSREFEFRWDKNIECEPFRIQFDQVYSTNKIMLKTLDSYTSWENTNDIVEVQVWGYKSGELPSIQISSSQGNYGVKNIVPMVIKIRINLLQ